MFFEDIIEQGAVAAEYRHQIVALFADIRFVFQILINLFRLRVNILHHRWQDTDQPEFSSFLRRKGGAFVQEWIVQ